MVMGAFLGQLVTNHAPSDHGPIAWMHPGYHLGKPLKPDHAALSGWLVRAWFMATGGSVVIDRVAMAGSPSLAFFDAAALISEVMEAGVLVPERLSFSHEVLRLAGA